MENVSIRHAGPEDAAAIAGLLGQLGYPASVEAAARRIDEHRASPADELIVAVVDGSVAGLAAVHVSAALEYDAPAAKLSAIVVDEGVRRRRVGKALVSAAEAEARSRGCCLLFLTTNERRKDAHAFYRAVGFEETGRRFAKALAMGTAAQSRAVSAGAAAVIFDDRRRVLLVRENYGRRRYTLPGGAADSGEAPTRTALRELHEETGAVAVVDHLIGLYQLVNGPFVHVFRCTITDGTPSVPGSGEIAEVGWYAAGDIPSPASNVLHHALPDALAGLRGVVREKLERVS